MIALHLGKKLYQCQRMGWQVTACNVHDDDETMKLNIELNIENDDEDDALRSRD